MRLLLRAAGEQEEFRRVFAFRAQGRLALRSNVQNTFWDMASLRKPHLSIRGEKLANVLLLACCYQEVSVRQWHRALLYRPGGGRSGPCRKRRGLFPRPEECEGPGGTVHLCRGRTRLRPAAHGPAGHDVAPERGDVAPLNSYPFRFCWTRRSGEVNLRETALQDSPVIATHPRNASPEQGWQELMLLERQAHSPMPLSFRATTQVDKT